MLKHFFCHFNDFVALPVALVVSEKLAVIKFSVALCIILFTGCFEFLPVIFSNFTMM